MTNREFYLQRRKAEFPVFVKVLEALPEGQLGYKPHERCNSAQAIVSTMTGELKSCVDAAATFRGEFIVPEAASHTEMVGKFRAWSDELVDRVSQMSESDWEKPAQFLFGGRVVAEMPVCDFLWMIHFDAIHHRGQLTSYLRPMGGKVPSIYGPSADDRGM